jgi:hypothetical protein
MRKTLGRFLFMLFISTAHLVLLIGVPSAFASSPALSGATRVAPSGTVERKILYESKYQNPVCASAPCDLKAVQVRLSHYRVNFGEENSFGTRLDFGYLTESIADLKRFVVVQKIKGCDFQSRLELAASGAPEIKKWVENWRHFWGDFVRFIHPDWVFDSRDQDPVYNSGTEDGKDRHFFYRTNQVAGSFERSTETLLGEEKTQHAWAYVVDLPSTAFTSVNPATQELTAKNLSMQFDTCLYRTEDVPVVVSGPGAFNEILGPPIYCLKWQNSWVYDFSSKKYTHPDAPGAIDEVCR